MFGFVIEIINKAVTSSLGFDATYFDNMFGKDYISGLVTIFKAAGTGMAIVFLCIGLLSIVGKGKMKTEETPFGLVMGFFFSLFFIYLGTDILKNFLGSAYGFSALYDSISGYAFDASMEGMFSGFGSGIDANGLAQAGIEIGVDALLGPLILILKLVFFVMIGISYFKLLVEVFERYLLMQILSVFSPLVGGTFTLSSMRNVGKSFLRMFFSAITLLFFNVITLGMVTQAIVNTSKHAGVLDFIMYMFALLAFMKIAQRFDSYMNQIGLGTAITGGGLVEETIGAAKAVGGFVSKGMSGASGAGKSMASGAGKAAGATGGALSKMLGAPAALASKTGLKDGSLLKTVGTKSGRDNFMNSLVGKSESKIAKQLKGGSIAKTAGMGAVGAGAFMKNQAIGQNRKLADSQALSNFIDNTDATNPLTSQGNFNFEDSMQNMVPLSEGWSYESLQASEGSVHGQVVNTNGEVHDFSMHTDSNANGTPVTATHGATMKIDSTPEALNAFGMGSPKPLKGSTPYSSQAAPSSGGVKGLPNVTPTGSSITEQVVNTSFKPNASKTDIYKGNLTYGDGVSFDVKEPVMPKETEDFKINYNVDESSSD